MCDASFAFSMSHFELIYEYHIQNASNIKYKYPNSSLYYRVQVAMAKSSDEVIIITFQFFKEVDIVPYLFQQDLDSGAP